MPVIARISLERNSPNPVLEEYSHLNTRSARPYQVHTARKPGRAPEKHGWKNTDHHNIRMLNGDCVIIPQKIMIHTK